jgi:hypothetical protein
MANPDDQPKEGSDSRWKGLLAAGLLIIVGALHAVKPAWLTLDWPSVTLILVGVLLLFVPLDNLGNLIESVEFGKNKVLFRKTKELQTEVKAALRSEDLETLREFPHRRDAEKAILSLRSTINSGVRSPETVSELVAHYQKHELTLERKAFATVAGHESYLTLHILPKWKDHKLSEVKTVAVEMWLDKLPLAPASRTKIRNIMSAVYTHAVSADKRSASQRQIELLLA